MADIRAILERNKAETKRLEELIARLTDADLTRSLGGGWTVAAALAHVAFWDRRALILVERWERDGIGDSGADSSAINEAALPMFLAIPPRAAAQIALDSAYAIDRKLDTVASTLLEQISEADSPVNLPRANHRAEHIEQIERVVKS